MRKKAKEASHVWEQLNLQEHPEFIDLPIKLHAVISKEGNEANSAHKEEKEKKKKTFKKKARH